MSDQGKDIQSKALDFFLELLRYRKFIFILTLFGVIISVWISFIIPKEYITFGSVKGSSSSSFNIGSLARSSGLSTSLGALADFALPNMAGGGEIDYLAAILTSRTVLDSIITRFNLKDYYGMKEMENVRLALLGDTEVKRDLLAGLVYIGVYNKSPQTAAEMTNYYIEMLNKIYTSLNSQAARNNRETIEKRYFQTLEQIIVLEDSMQVFQEKKGIYNIKVQTEEAAKTAANLKTAIILKEIERDVKKSTFGNQAPEVSTVEIEINELVKNYNNLISGTATNLDIFIPFHDTPDLALKYARIFRDIEINTELMKVLIPLLEQARIQEKKESPSILVLDKGIVPERKSRPKKAIIVLIGTFSFFFAGLVIALMKNNLRNIKEKNPQMYEKLHSVYDTFVSDIKFWRKKKS